MEKEMKKIVVTGATSMIGSALIEECVKHDIEVYAVLRSASGKQDRLPDSSLVHLIDSSLETLEELPELIPQGCDTFYHIAWGNTGENRNRSTELQSRNIGYTLAAVRAANALGCKRFIGAGSQAEYGPMDVERISPDSPTNPSTPYGASKLASGHLAGMLCRELGMECIWPRIFSVYGIHEKETTMIASGLRRMLKGEPTEFTPAMQRWDYLYSKDAGRAYYLIGEKGRDKAVYCIGSGEAHPLQGIYPQDGRTYRSRRNRYWCKTIPAGGSDESLCRHRISEERYWICAGIYLRRGNQRNDRLDQKPGNRSINKNEEKNFGW